MRLVLMKLFQWSVETFETVWNVGNCEHVTLTKNMTKMCYQFDKKQSYPSKVCWATRPIWIVLRSKKASDETEKRLAMLQKLKEQNNWNLVEEVAAQEAEHHTEGHKHDEHGHEVAGKWLEIDRVIDQVENTELVGSKWGPHHHLLSKRAGLRPVPASQQHAPQSGCRRHPHWIHGANSTPLHYDRSEDAQEIGAVPREDTRHAEGHEMVPHRPSLQVVLKWSSSPGM
eukprot:CAMPEP_0195040042 /NCGR_PEP_ID=MMETSP0326_2-20130528/80124_1 /TAXON_ID=2866 ORGANISM="Crypthecodinium cohnii, Strain Seligo" /NCGR_SAMPLE_ID=MMETSP0326_2 /ASSEMBLY_ACC=CAM_ASM_000348 /LENGTH=227 /DNA_ID=CAMNT_0040066939 /DNA_START=25 /DNA_END=708 /DNA_ORIENTATION=-